MDKLHLIIGEDIPEDAPSLFSDIILYIKDDNEIPIPYADINLTYFINHSEFNGNIEEPEYYFYEGYNPETKQSKYICMLIPLGELRGVYRLVNWITMPKIRTIKPFEQAVAYIKKENKNA